MMRNGRIALLCVTALIVSAPAMAAELFPTLARRQAFLKALAERDAQYDEKEQMLQSPYSSPGYHTTLTGGMVHSTRGSLDYAVALLDSGEPERLKRAEAVLRRVIALQDQDPNSRTYGIWSWFLEEPLDKMSPPDWNWADFCGTQLLQVAIDHGDRLPPDLKQKVQDSILHAARSIQRRDVQPGYTNIALMGTYVTLVAGERLNVMALRDYGRQRLRRFWEYTLTKGSFSEYNSPTYTCVAIEEISRMLQHVRDEESRPVLEKLNNFAWLHMARRFHSPTRQWAGPHSRCYSTLLPASTLGFIQRATDGRIELVPEDDAWQSIDAQRIALRCPKDLDRHFTQLYTARMEIEAFVQNERTEHDVVGRTYLHPDFALGSINIGDFWNQRRPLIAYWKTAAGVAALRPRLLHDNYDYSSASLFTIQDGTDILVAVTFATDRGDTHISLDKIKDATIRAGDLRLRLQFEGDLGDLVLPGKAEVGKAVDFTSGPLAGTYCIHDAAFDGLPIRMETGRDAETAWVDLVLYAGPQREFNFAKMDKAAIVFTLSLACEPADFPDADQVAAQSSTTNKKSGPPPRTLDNKSKAVNRKTKALAGTFRTAPPAVHISIAEKLVTAPIRSPRQIATWQRTNKATMALTVPTRPLPTKEQKEATAAKLADADPWKSSY
jgi:hypothetical protein